MDIVKDFMERIEVLEDKLKGEDRETLEGILFMFEECAKKLFETEERINKATELIKGLREKYFKMCVEGSNNDLSELLEILEGE